MTRTKAPGDGPDVKNDPLDLDREPSCLDQAMTKDDEDVHEEHPQAFRPCLNKIQNYATKK